MGGWGGGKGESGKSMSHPLISEQSPICKHHLRVRLRDSLYGDIHLELWNQADLG